MTAPTYAGSTPADVQTCAIAAQTLGAVDSVADAEERAWADIGEVKLCRGRASEAVGGIAVKIRSYVGPNFSSARTARGRSQDLPALPLPH